MPSPTDPIVVATTHPGQLPFFPTAVQLPDGPILVAYREARHHVSSNGRIALVVSDDEGRTWGEPRIVVDTVYDDRDPMLTVLADGDLLLMYFQIDWTTMPWRVPALQVVRSSDGGQTWSEPVTIDSSMCQDTPERWHRFEAGHICAHGRIRQLHSGDLLAPVYGVFPGDAHHSAAVVRSTDNGETFSRDDEVLLARGNHMYGEPVLSVLADGNVVALLRTDAAAEVCRSYDGGFHWSKPEKLALWASSADTATLADGSLLLAYGDCERKRYQSRPTVATVIDDPNGPWDTGRQELVYDAGHDTFDQANPSVLELGDGSLFFVTYDVFRRAIVAVIRPRADFV